MTDDTGTTRPGLGWTAKEDWPKVEVKEGEKPIDRLKPGSELHANVLTYLIQRIQDSERSMTQFYARWGWNEKRVQAYIDLPKYEQLMKEANRLGEPPKVTSIVLPYSFATISTIVTYLIQAFTGVKPFFQLDTYNADYTQNARHLEQMLQYNSDHTRLIKHMFQFFNDGELYGLAVMRTQWKAEKASRSKWIERPNAGWLSQPDPNAPPDKLRIKEDRTIFEGTMIDNVDPYMFFPDPRVPMAQVSRKGEYVFWRSYEGKHTLKKEESAGLYKWIDYIPFTVNVNKNDQGGFSNRALLSQGDPNPGMAAQKILIGNYYQIDQGSIDIIPRELGLGESENVERWIFAIGNKGQIIQAEPLELDHGMHPVIVAEPYTMGYGFGQAGLADYLGPVQDTVSWFVNSHIHNVRSALNNMFVVDPSMVEMQDVKNPNPAKIIRLKRSAFGRDVREALTQLQVNDVTRGHVADLDVFMRIGDAMSAINDNLRGLQDAGGRKSATEARTSAEAAASRLAAHARLISAQAIIDLAEQMTMNYQQSMSESWFVKVLGTKAAGEVVRISPDMLQGDFIFPVNDGTLPLDRVALLDVWKEIMMAFQQMPALNSKYSLPRIFAFVADLGGAKNLDQFKLMPNEQIQQQAQAGNMVPTSEIGKHMPTLGQTPGTPSQPGKRLAGKL